MKFPAARPSADVCEISRHRSPTGAATVVYRAVRTGLVTFGSSYVQLTEDADPAMLGHARISARLAR
jgi:hypothetical protein